jgi:alpha-glucosidase
MWPEFKGRDGCRTPMVWDRTPMAASRLASPGCQCREHIAMAVSTQNGRPGSMLEHYKRFIAFRRNIPSFAKGDIEFLMAERSIFTPLLEPMETSASCVPSTWVQAGGYR